MTLAERFAWRAPEPLALVVCGGPATGKSYISGALGARSGLPRTAALLYFSDGEDLIVIASNFGGDVFRAVVFRAINQHLISSECATEAVSDGDCV